MSQIKTKFIANLAVTAAKLASGAATASQALFADGSGNAAYRSILSTDIPTLNQNTTGTATSITGNITSNQVQGVTTNSTATIGFLGEYEVSFQSTTNFPASTQYGDLTSLSLTAGDWEITAIVNATLNGATVNGATNIGISTTSGNSTTGLTFGDTAIPIPAPTGSSDSGGVIAPFRASLASTTIYYLKYRSSYSAGTPQAAGRLSARRLR